ncbi:uncharacterized protein LOC133503345 [Syngnathoides biaculeatus]|uniref:uncharacterized protein LOC133503345 n=1 Tax=Syngnathoides biaculeatus TaxID=300417 RepID=UPI002ADE375C|nr:uncharacterized protein LOC133503345 [Syngnathoides biaculeatus]
MSVCAMSAVYWFQSFFLITMTHLVVVLLWCEAALPGLLAVASLPAVTCDEESVAAATSLGVQHINAKHKHGFRFKLQEVQSSKYQQVSGGCHIDVNVKLAQTKCYVTNPKPDNQSLKAVNDSVFKFNREGKQEKYFTLMEVACVTLGSVPTIGMITSFKFALVETTCPREARNTFGACTPLCPDRANHTFCQTFYYNSYRQVGELDCELYPPRNPGPYPTDVPEPVCSPLFHESPEACLQGASELPPIRLSITFVPSR